MELLARGKEFILKIPKEYYIPLAGACIGLFLLGYGIVGSLPANKQNENLQITDFPQNSTFAASSSALQNHVDVEGAVVKPGVVAVAQNARVQDVLNAAGGLASHADRDWVEKHLNLAAKIQDGVKLYIPPIGEVAAAKNGPVGGISSTQVLGSETSQIDINSASSDSLDGLPGIGPVTAEKIIAGRPYASAEDLLTKKVVSQSIFSKIKDLVVAQ